jgi:hypothetical protein
LPIVSSVGGRPFHFPEDTIAFPNETLWSYARDPHTGQQVHVRREPPPSYTLRCFALCRAVKLFFKYARFAPDEKPLTADELRERVRSVLTSNSRTGPNDRAKIVIPGMRNLRELSLAHESLLKEEMGGAWRSYFQRGHWRMVFPFSRASQRRESAAVCRDVERDGVSVLHVFTFPALTVNHALVVFGANCNQGKLSFSTYDPNTPAHSLTLEFDPGTQSFRLPETAYFIGGQVNAYRVYSGLLY